MKKIFIFFSCILLVLLLVLSRNNTNNQSIENLAYVIAIGIDNGNSNLIKLTLQIATSSSDSSSSNGSSAQSSNSTITSVECNSIDSGINLINSYISKQLNLSHCKIIVFSEDFAVNGVADEISTLVNNVEMRPDCSIAISKCPAEDFLNINKPTLISLSARFYEVVVHSGEYTGFSTNVTLADFYKAMKDPTLEPIAILAGINFPSTATIPSYQNYIDLDSSYTADEVNITNKNNMQICGLAVFNNNALIGEINSIDSLCHLILSHQLPNATISIPDPYDISRVINLSITELQSPKISVKIVNGSPYISCNIELRANILSLASNSNYVDTDKLQTITDYANSYLESHITDYLYKTSKDYKTDIIGFGKHLISNFSTIQEWNDFNWRYNYRNSFFDTNVNTTIYNSNLIQKN